MKLRYRPLLAALALPAVFLTACSGALKQPEVRLESVSIGGVGLRGATLYADVHVTNPNRFDLETRQLTYDLQLPDPNEEGGWVSFAKGAVDEHVRVRSNSSTIIKVPIQFRYDDANGAILDTGTFNYRVRGDVRLTEPVGRTIPFSKTGIVSLAGVR
jgi:LEA14-like dessication related protein